MCQYTNAVGSTASWHIITLAIVIFLNWHIGTLSNWHIIQMEKASKPPSMGITVPVTNAEASLASHCKVPSNSSGFPKRRNGVCATIVLQRSLGDPSGLLINARFCSVRKNPGAMAFTRRPSPNLIASSPAMYCVKLLIAAFAHP